MKVLKCDLNIKIKCKPAKFFGQAFTLLLVVPHISQIIF